MLFCVQMDVILLPKHLSVCSLWTGDVMLSIILLCKCQMNFTKRLPIGRLGNIERMAGVQDWELKTNECSGNLLQARV